MDDELYGQHAHKHTRDCLDDDMEKRRGEMSPTMVTMEHRLHMKDTLLPESPRGKEATMRKYGASAGGGQEAMMTKGKRKAKR